jgi:hypothetical protein
MLKTELFKAVVGSDKVAAAKLLSDSKECGDPWALHLALYPVVQRVLNPPFFNPHWPKVYSICRELAPYLSEEGEVAALLRVEVNEYAQRPKFEEFPLTSPGAGDVSFEAVERAVGALDRQAAARAMYDFLAKEGKVEFARRMLLLGSGYLDKSLGHSISCTAFILLEMMEREADEAWPAVTCLSDYFCKGEFNKTPKLGPARGKGDEDIYSAKLLRACSGTGIVNLHHTLTAYALARTKRFFNEEQRQHLTGAWLNFMGNKNDRPRELPGYTGQAPESFGEFYETFSTFREDQTAQMAMGMLGSPEDRVRLGRYLIKGALALYNGNYDPHYLTPLGSTLWLLSDHWRQEEIFYNGLHQYLGHLFHGLRPKRAL